MNLEELRTDRESLKEVIQTSIQYFENKYAVIIESIEIDRVIQISGIINDLKLNIKI